MLRRTVLVAALLLGGCSAHVNDVGPQLVSDIKGAESHLVTDVSFERQNILDPALIIIQLREGATRRDALAVLCGVVQPLVSTAPSSAKDIGVVAHAADGVTHIASVDVDCPGWPFPD